MDMKTTALQMTINRQPWWSNLSFVVARVSWLFLALLAVCLFLMFSWFYWHLTTTTPCGRVDCSALLAWFGRYGISVEFFAMLYLVSFVVPVMIWIGLALWVFLAQPRQLWSYVFSLFFLVGWYGEISRQYLGGSFPLALRYMLESLGLNGLAASPDLHVFSAYLRHIFKMLADNLLMLMVFAFPNGRFYPSWSKFYLLLFVLLSFGYSMPFLRETPWNYARLPFPFNLIFNLGLLFVPVWGSVARYRNSSDLVRHQVRDVVLLLIVNGVIYALDLILVVLTQPGYVSSAEIRSPVIRPLLDLGINWFNSLAMIWLALAVAQAIIRQQLFDIRFVLNRALAYSALILSTGVLYGLIVGGLGSLFRQSNLWFSVLATGVIAVLFQPLLMTFRQMANRLFYGERNDPYRAISKFGKQLEVVYKPEELALTIVSTVATTLKLPYVALKPLPAEVGQSISFGDPVGKLLEFPMVIKGASVGLLIVSTRFVGESFSSSETRLLEDLASRAAVAVQEALLNQELQASKEAIVLAREEERKRIRRDLHDGLGVTLASLSMNLQVSKNLISQNPARAETMIAASAQNVQEAITDIRRLVYGLRPPALDDLGLEGALRQQIGQMLEVIPEIEIEPLESLPAAVEVAVFRITSEALNNIAKHARAKRVTLKLHRDETGLLLEIRDDGIGISSTRASGVGLHSMRERATELGGHFEITSENGTRVLAWLPLRENG
jgi:signal transduction histidine kinase